MKFALKLVNPEFGIKKEKGTLTINAPWDTIGNTKIELTAEHYYHFYI